MIWDVLSAIIRAMSTAGSVIIGGGCGVVCLLLLIWFVRRASARWKRLRLLNTAWPHAAGRPTDGGSTVPFAALGLVTYTFEVDGVTYTGADDPSALRRHRPGTPFDVVYDPENPGANNMLAPGASGRAVVWLIMSVLLSGVTAAGAVLGFALAIDAIV